MRESINNSSIAPGGTLANKRFLDDWVSYDADVDEASRILLCDAQTSGGLLIACAPDRAEALVHELNARKTPCAAIVGTLEAGPPGRMRVVA